MVSHVVVIGAGPAGLTAAHDLLRAGVRVTLLERSAKTGGLGGTTRFEGRDGTYRFDFGGHRFITRNTDLLKLVEDLLGDDLLTAERQSVIRLGGRTYQYPLSLANLLKNAPVGMLAGASFDLLRMLAGRRKRRGDDFAAWTEARFGPTLYNTFFAGYTAKLWGIAPTALSGDWAEQRITQLDLRDVARRLLSKGAPVTYARRYRYPRHGFGVLFERLGERIVSLGGQVRTGVTVTGFTTVGDTVTEVLTDGGTIACDAVISTVPLPEMVRLTGGQSPLRFRGIRFFNLPVAAADVSPWTWQYLSDPEIMATRLQEPRRRSAEMAPPGRTSLMLEIPCDPGDRLWTMPDDDLYPMAARDLERLGIDSATLTGERFSVRSPYAYPLLSLGYQAERDKAIAHLDRFRNLLQCGRQGTFRYIFTDTAMEMGQVAAAGLLAGRDVRRQIYDHRNERTVIEADSVA